MKLSDTFILPKTDRYTNPDRAGDDIPYVYGDMTTNSTGGVISCPYIDTSNYVYALAAHAIKTVANGNTISIYVDGDLQSSGYTINESNDYESQGTIATVTFDAEKTDEVTAKFQGKLDSDGDLIENPIEIIEDWLTEMDIDNAKETTAFAIAKELATDQSFTAAGVMFQDQSPAYWLTNLLSSFLGDWYVNNENKLVVTLDVTGQNQYNIAGWLDEWVYSDLSLTQRVENICNQAVINYAPSFSHRDRRFKEGVRTAFDGYDDGDSSKDVSSQNQYGVIKGEPFNLWWIRADAVATTVQARIIERFKNPVWLMKVVENRLNNYHCEQGEYIVGSCHILNDENNLAMKNQIWRILEIERQLNTQSLRLLLQDTGSWYPIAPIYYDGESLIGQYNGRTRDRRRLI
jgi:hypothetical protein